MNGRPFGPAGGPSDKEKLLRQIALRANWPEDLVFEIFRRLYNDQKPDNQLLTRIASVTDLLPEWMLSRLTVRTIENKVKRSSTRAEWTEERAAALEMLLLKLRNGVEWDKDEELKTWAARSNKDLTIRRVRLADVFAYY